jgi:nucleotide-binding universal stress UspA family protein
MAPRIVVPLDSSPAGEHAVPFARALAQRKQAGVTLVSAIEVAIEFDAWAAARELSPQDAVQQWVDERRAYLGQIAAQFNGLDVATDVCLGHPADEIVSFVDELDDPILVLTSHARTGVAQIVVGSVAFTIVHRVRCPVYVIRRFGDDERPPEPSFATVLVPLDGSPLSERALDQGLAVIGDPKPTLHLLRAVESPRWITGPLSAGLVGEYYDASRAEAQVYLDAQAERLRSGGYAVEVHVVEGRAADVIAGHAHELGVSQIVMATHARSTAGRVFMGSVALSVLQSARSPLLLIHPRED